MTQKDKELLIIDLCARLIYGVKVWYKYYPTNITEQFATSIRLADKKIALSSKFNKEGDWYPIEEAGEILIKPYLRLMSSMTEEEKRELCSIRPCFINSDDIVSGTQCSTFIQASECQDWLNANNFDYRSLIKKGLALEAPEGMYS